MVLLKFASTFSIQIPIVSSITKWLYCIFPDGQMYREEREASMNAAAAASSPYDFYGKPFYGKTTTDVIVQEGSHAFFHCLVHNLGNQTVRILRKIMYFLPKYYHVIKVVLARILEVDTCSIVLSCIM